jgi:hypothetical protein
MVSIVYHLLLARPWQYDRNVINYGRHNTYTLHIKGKCIILVSNSGEVVVKSKGIKGNKLRECKGTNTI